MESASLSLEQLRAERDAARHELDLVRGSISWRLLSPLRGVGSRHPALSRSARRFYNSVGDSRHVASWFGGMVRLGFARVGGRNGAPIETDGAARGPSEPTAVFSAHPIRSTSLPQRGRQGTVKGRVLCVSHVLPYPPRAGNEYRIDRMLNWLSANGWDVLLLVCPPPNKNFTPPQLAEAATRYPNLIVCQRDGTLRHHLADGGAMLERLCGRRPRTFGSTLREVEDRRPGARTLLDTMRAICPDVLIELLLHLEAEFNPAALLAEYVFMTRPFALLRPGLFKVIDTHDVFSTRQSKVGHYRIEQDVLAIAADLEAELLNRADLLIAIQPTEADDLRQLAQQRSVITVGVDFPVVERPAARSNRPVVLMVASANPINAKGLNDFIRLAWPLVLKAVPQAEFHVVGAVGATVDPLLPGVVVHGEIENLDGAYANARVVINPAVAGTGLKIKTLEALGHLRPIVLWPSGVDGLGPDLCALCRVATDWFDFTRQVIDLVGSDDGADMLMNHRPELARQLAPNTVYAPLTTALDAALTSR